MTTPIETAPGTDRSKPPCWITSVWPSATMARTDANGNMPCSAPLLMLVDANSTPARARNSNATTIVQRPRDVAMRPGAVRVGNDCAVVVISSPHAEVTPGASDVLCGTVQLRSAVHKGLTLRKRELLRFETCPG